MIRSRRRGFALVALLFALVGLTGCRSDTQSQEIGVHVTGHVMFPTSKVVKDCVAPSTNKYVGIGDDVYVYPAGLRTFTFDDKKGADYPPITVVSKDNVTMHLSGVLSFNINPDCEVLKRFHQQIGTKRWGDDQRPAYVNGEDFRGWTSMLDVQLGKPTQNSLTDDAAAETYLDLYTSPQVRQRLEKTLAQTLPGRVRELSGGDYFQNFKVLLNKPDAPESIVKALEAKQAAVQDNLAQAARNTTALTQFDQIKGCTTKGISEETCAFLYAINSGKVPYAVPPGGSAVVGAPAPK